MKFCGDFWGNHPSLVKTFYHWALLSLLTFYLESVAIGGALKGREDDSAKKKIQK